MIYWATMSEVGNLKDGLLNKVIMALPVAIVVLSILVAIGSIL